MRQTKCKPPNQPPFFKPIFSHVKGPAGLHPDPSAATAAKSGQQQPPKVKIFLSLPESKPGSVVKIPNVSHIQVSLLRKAVGETKTRVISSALKLLHNT
jgi:hypothetical protein